MLISTMRLQMQEQPDMDWDGEASLSKDSDVENSPNEGTLDDLMSEVENVIEILENLTPEEEEVLAEIRELYANSQLYIFGAMIVLGWAGVSILLIYEELSKGDASTPERVAMFGLLLLFLFMFYKLNQYNERRRFNLTQLVDSLDEGAVQKIIDREDRDLLHIEQLNRMKEKYKLEDKPSNLES